MTGCRLAHAHAVHGSGRSPTDVRGRAAPVPGPARGPAVRRSPVVRHGWCPAAALARQRSCHEGLAHRSVDDCQRRHRRAMTFRRHPYSRCLHPGGCAQLGGNHEERHLPLALAGDNHRYVTCCVRGQGQAAAVADATTRWRDNCTSVAGAADADPSQVAVGLLHRDPTSGRADAGAWLPTRGCKLV